MDAKTTRKLLLVCVLCLGSAAAIGLLIQYLAGGFG